MSRSARQAEPTYFTISFRLFKGRTFTAVLAGLALIMIFSPVAGLMPSRAGLGGFCFRTILHRPGIW